MRSGGALLALPARVTLGLLDAGAQTYGALQHGCYGRRATLLLLAFMALLRIRTPEHRQGQPPGELGVLLGLDRAPAVTPLRRTLWELAARRQATQFSQRLAARWVQDNADAVGVLSVDGHVRPSQGTAHTLPTAAVTRRRWSMPATPDVWVHQCDAPPRFVVTAPANDGLIARRRQAILPEVRRRVGDRRVTLVVDREGWSPTGFRAIHVDGCDVLTARTGAYTAWPVKACQPITAVVEGRRVGYELAERSVEGRPGFRMREIRCLGADGHQTAVVTTRHDLAIEVVAARMCERWVQAHVFRAMRQQCALDALVPYVVEPADPERTVPNPQRMARANPAGQRPTMRGFKIASCRRA